MSEVIKKETKTFTEYLEEDSFIFTKDINEAKKIAISVVNTVTKDSNLINCEKNSIRQCVRDALSLGLPVDFNQYCWLVPYKNRATLQIGYKGYIYKLSSLGAIVDMPMPIYKDDEFVVSSNSKDGDTYTLTRKNPFANEEDIIGYVVFIKYKKRGYLTTMSKEEIDKVKGCAKQGYVWVKWYNEMAKKTIIKRACKIHFAKELQSIEEYDNIQYDMQPKTEGLEELNA